MDNDLAARREQSGDILLGDFWFFFPARFACVIALHDFDAGIERVGDDVPVVQEGVLLEANIHEGGLEPIFEVLHLALVDGANQPVIAGSFNREVFQFALLQNRDAGFQRFGVNHHFLDDLFLGSDELFDLLDHLFDRGPRFLDKPLRLARWFGCLFCRFLVSLLRASEIGGAVGLVPAVLG